LAGAPLWVPVGRGDEGWLLSLVHGAGLARTDLVVLRADDVTVRATAALPSGIPAGLHACWALRRGLPAPVAFRRLTRCGGDPHIRETDKPARSD
jgi:hypothetical protein